VPDPAILAARTTKDHATVTRTRHRNNVKSCQRHERRRGAALRHADGPLPGSILGMSVVTLGEIEYGWQWRSSAKNGLTIACRKFIKVENPQLFKVGRHVAVEYGRLKAILCDRYMPESERGKACRSEQLIDPITLETLGADENGLWITAEAIVENSVLITNDKLTRIREVAMDRRHVEKGAQ